MIRPSIYLGPTASTGRGLRCALRQTPTREFDARSGAAGKPSECQAIDVTLMRRVKAADL